MHIMSQYHLHKLHGMLMQMIRLNTEISLKHFTPELKLHLITPNCRLWLSGPEECPFHDPYWAFYWPGGQAMTRFIFDNPWIIKNKQVLDIGSGCGATAIASHFLGAKQVVANDIDEVALHAIRLNYKLNINVWSEPQALSTQDALVVNSNNQLCNKNRSFFLTSDDLLASDSSVKSMRCTQLNSSDHVHGQNVFNMPIPFFDVVLFGDMFYDEEMIAVTCSWAQKFSQLSPRSRIFFSDPGRGFLAGHPISTCLKKMQSYDLPAEVTQEHYGCTKVDILEWSREACKQQN